MSSLSESESALLAKYVYTYKELFFHCSQCTYTEIDITAKNKDNKAEQVKVKNKQDSYVHKYVKK